MVTYNVTHLNKREKTEIVGKSRHSKRAKYTYTQSKIDYKYKCTLRINPHREPYRDCRITSFRTGFRFRGSFI